MRQRDGRFEKLGEGEFAGAIFLQRQREACDRAGHADAERGIARLGVVRLAVGTEEHIASRRGRRRLAVIDRHILVAAGEMDDHESAATDIAGARVGDGHREAGRHGGVNRIAALLQDIGADTRGDLLLGDDEAVLGRNRMNAVGGLRHVGVAREDSGGQGESKSQHRPSQAPADRK